MFKAMQAALPAITFFVLSLLGVGAVLFYEAGKKKSWVAKRLRSSKKKSATTGPWALLFRALTALGDRTKPSDGKDLTKIRKELSYAGYRDGSAVSLYFGVRTLLALGLAAVALLLVLLFGRIELRSLTIAAFLTAIGYYLPQYILRHRISARSRKIFRELPDTLDLLVICTEAGLGFEMALFRVSKELKDVAPVLSKEFAQYFFETRGGVARNTALTNLKDRNDSAGLRAVVDVIIQSFRFGTDVASALRVHAESMRTERRQIAEEKGTKIAVKLTLPLVLLILPALLLVILGPALLRLAAHFSG